MELRAYTVSTDQDHLLHHTPVSCEASACGKRREDGNSHLGRQHIHLFLKMKRKKIGFRSTDSAAENMLPEASTQKSINVCQIIWEK